MSTAEESEPSLKTVSSKTVNRRSRSSRAQSRLAWMLLTPTIVVLTIVIIIPVLQSPPHSLSGTAGLDKTTGLGTHVAPLVGLTNYTDIIPSSVARF